MSKFTFCSFWLMFLFKIVFVICFLLVTSLFFLSVFSQVQAQQVEKFQEKMLILKQICG